MRLLKPPPSLGPRMLGGTLTAEYRADGRMVIKKWPRPRRGKLPAVTEQQVATWDDVLAMTKHAIAQQRIEALSLSDGTGFYARDLLISSCYGHTVSWPGQGVYFDGLGTIPLAVNSRGQPTFPPRSVGDPQPVNILTSWQIDSSADPVLISATTYHESLPTLFLFCCEPQKITVYQRRRGQEVVHGNKLFFPCQPAEFASTMPFGQAHVWEVPYGTFAPPCTNCAMVVAEPTVAPLQNWNSLPIGCPTLPPLPPNPLGWYYISVGGSAGPHGYVPPQSVIDAFNAQMDALAACLNSNFFVHEHRGYLYVDALWLPQLAGMVDGSYKEDFCPPTITCKYSTTQVDNEVPNLPDPGTWFYDWSFLVNVHL